MPRLIALLTLLALTAPGFTQQLTPNYGAFYHVVDVSAYEGRRFKVTAAVRAECIDTLAGAEVWVRIDKSDKTMGFFYNMMNHPIRDPLWKVYTVAGKVDKLAKWINFGGLYQRRGMYCFDDFHLYIEAGHGKWTELPLEDGGFEGDTTAFRKNWFHRRDVGFPGPQLTTLQPFEGSAAVIVDSRTYTPTKTRGYGDNDSAGRFITANGIRFYVESYGQGQPLLLLHGNSSSIETFSKQIPVLSRQYRVIAVDSRGQGKSTEDGKTYTYDLFAEDMNALLDTLRLDSVDVLGWSDGGNTGLIMAMRYPRKVRRLATMGANVFIDGTVVDNTIFRMLRKEQRELKNDTLYGSVNRSRLITLLLTEPRHSFDQLRAIRCPVLVMAGEKDVIHDQHTRAIAAHIPGSTLVIFPNGTHYEPAEHPDVFNKTVADFFAAAPHQ